MSGKVNWFDRGRDAFTEGQRCVITDARISGKDRQAWYDGWNHQRNLNAKPLLTEARQEALAALRAIREGLK